MGDIIGGTGGGLSVANTGGVNIGGGGAIQPLLSGGVAAGGGATPGAVPGMFPANINNILNTPGGAGGAPTGGFGAPVGVGDTAPTFGLAPPGGFDPGGVGGEGLFGLPGLGGTLGNNFAVDQSQTQTGIAPQQAGGLEASIRAAMQLAANQFDPNSALQKFLGGPGAGLFGQGQGFLSGVAQAQSGLNALEDPSIVQGRIDALGQDIRTQLGEFIGGAGGLRTEGALSGNLGGGRGDVREGIAARGAADAFAREAAGIRESAAGRRLQGLLGGAQAGQIGLGGSQQLFNLGLSPSNAQFSPLLSLASIIGDPKVLTSTLSQALSQGVTAGEGTGSLLGGVGGLLEGLGAI